MGVLSSPEQLQSHRQIRGQEVVLTPSLCPERKRVLPFRPWDHLSAHTTGVRPSDQSRKKAVA